MPFCAYQNDVMKNFAVVMNAVIQKVNCTKKTSVCHYNVCLSERGWGGGNRQVQYAS